MDRNDYGVTLAARGSPDMKLEAFNSGEFYLAPTKATVTAGICTSNVSRVS